MARHCLRMKHQQFLMNLFGFWFHIVRTSALFANCLKRLTMSSNTAVNIVQHVYAGLDYSRGLHSDCQRIVARLWLYVYAHYFEPESCLCTSWYVEWQLQHPNVILIPHSVQIYCSLLLFIDLAGLADTTLYCLSISACGNVSGYCAKNSVVLLILA